MKRFFLALFLLLAPLSSRAQEAAPVASIVDVLPTVDPGTPPQSPILSFDLLIGTNERPVWWGRTIGDEVAFRMTDFQATATARRNGQSSPIKLVYATFYSPRWNEAWGLYAVHVRALLDGGKWPRGADIVLRGELPAPFSDSQGTLPFEIVSPSPAKGLIRDAQLVSPKPSPWLKAVRVFHVQNYEAGVNSLLSYQLEVTFPIRFIAAQGRDIAMAHRRISTSAQIVDGQGEVLAPSHRLPTAIGGGSTADGHSDFEPRDFSFAGTPFIFVTNRSGWSQGYADAAPNLWARQTIYSNDGLPLTFTVPVQRDGKLLEGEISPRDWKIETPAPQPN